MHMYTLSEPVILGLLYEKIWALVWCNTLHLRAEITEMAYMNLSLDMLVSCDWF